MNFFSEGYIYPDALNSSLWTLFFEFFDYIAIILFINNKKRPSIGLIFLLAGSIAVQFLIGFGLPPNYYIDRSTILTIPFAIGGLLLITRHYWHRKKLSLVLLAISFMGIFLSNGNDERSILSS